MPSTTPFAPSDDSRSPRNPRKITKQTIFYSLAIMLIVFLFTAILWEYPASAFKNWTSQTQEKDPPELPLDPNDPSHFNRPQTKVDPGVKPAFNQQDQQNPKELPAELAQGPLEPPVPQASRRVRRIAELIADLKALQIDTEQRDQRQTIRAFLAKGMHEGRLLLPMESATAQSQARWIEFLYVPPGKFHMGRTEDEIKLANLNTNVLLHDSTGPKHLVKIERGYFLASREVTLSQYSFYFRSIDSPRDKDPLSRELSNLYKEQGWPEQPIRNISWMESQRFCQWLSKRSGLPIRLPTEVEWEYAARGLTSRKYPWYDGEPFPTELESLKKPASVGQTSRDRSWIGVFDMGGNVSEWCLDIFNDKAYSSWATEGRSYTPKADPFGSASDQTDLLAYRVYRGGSYRDQPTNCESATRRKQVAKNISEAIGFRPALIIPPDLWDEPPVSRAENEDSPHSTRPQ